VEVLEVRGAAEALCCEKAPLTGADSHINTAKLVQSSNEVWPRSPAVWMHCEF